MERTTYKLRMQVTRTKRSATRPRRARNVRLNLMAELHKAEITARIRQARKEAGLTQPEMAKLLEVAMRTYQNYEDDRVPWDLMGRISDVTGRSLRWLLHGEDDAEPSQQVMLRLDRLDRKLDELLTRDTAADSPETLTDIVSDFEDETNTSRDSDPPDDTERRRRGRRGA
jgi:transcriptional regulator with XRE-family HTH domain